MGSNPTVSAWLGVGGSRREMLTLVFAGVGFFVWINNMGGVDFCLASLSYDKDNFCILI